MRKCPKHRPNQLQCFFHISASTSSSLLILGLSTRCKPINPLFSSSPLPP
uniref:Uncharacterized protein n=1 Tax=Brassica oleracea var. oleracea TaxID=109376 RepID=A0A0D3CN82_BRAOL